MLGCLKILALVYLQFIFTECLIPQLFVHKIDKQLIHRKRKDTLEMCKIFTTKNEKKPDYSNVRNLKRGKRSIDDKVPGSPAINAEDQQRVENIVNAFYDDKSVPDVRSKIAEGSRRFNFAPAILMGPEDTNVTYEDGPPQGPSTVAIKWPKRWPKGVIPFFIDSKTYDMALAEIIMKAFDYFEKATCIRLQRLREKPTDQKSLSDVEWLYISNPSGIRQCVHSNEHKKNQGVQMVVFGYDCMSQGEIVHEVMHILGFSHEHTRPDRDRHVTILWDNIKPGYKKYFQLRSEDPLMGLKYDYNSVLHYPQRAFSKNGRITILADPGSKIGQRDRLSDTDVEKIGLIYSNECVNRNMDYLLKTCPSVVKSTDEVVEVNKGDIDQYFDDRIWPYGIINYKLRDKMEFSAEERENIKAVMRHIEKETCIEFREIAAYENGDNADSFFQAPDYDINKELFIPEILKNTETAPADASAQPSDQKSSENKPDAGAQEDKLNDIVEKEIKTGGLTDKDVKPSGLTDQETKTNTLTDSEAKPVVALPDQAAEPNVLTDIEAKSNALTDQDTKSNTLTDQETKSNTLTDQETKSNALTDQDAKSNTLTDQDTKSNTLTDQETKSNDLTDTEAKSSELNENDKVPPKEGVRKSQHKWKPPTPSRRHAKHIFVITRNNQPGCPCPKPGRPDGNQALEINNDCFNTVNDLLHLFVHVLGLEHQHNMHDRDQYLQIVWPNISPDIKEDLEKVLPPAASVGFPYDYQSVMHYPWLEIKDGVTNIMYPIWNDGWAMGHWQGLSWTDVQKINFLYRKQCLERKKFVNKS